MSYEKVTAGPVRLVRSDKSGLRTQFAALPYRFVNDHLQICLVSTRGRRRWILPKGWPMDGQTPAEAAAQEALEEAGLVGSGTDRCVGLYSYVKKRDKSRTPCLVMVFPVLVRQVLQDWPERKERRRVWASPAEAAGLLTEPDLRRIVLDFAPDRLPR